METFERIAMIEEQMIVNRHDIEYAESVGKFDLVARWTRENEDLQRELDEINSQWEKETV